MVDNKADYFNPSVFDTVGADEFNAEKTPTDPSFFQTLGASLRLDNELVSAIAQEKYLSEALDENKSLYSTTDYLGMAKEQGFFGQDLEDFVYVDSDKQFTAVVNQKQSESRDREILENSGAVGVLTDIAVGITNPTTLLTAVVGGPLAIGAKTVGGAVGRGAALGAVESTVSETLLQQSQLDRPLEESYFAVGTTTLLSGLLSGVGQAAINGTERRLKRKISKSVDESRANLLDGTEALPESYTDQAQFLAGRSASAAEAGPSLEELALVGSDTRIGRLIQQNPIARKVSPVFELAAAGSRTARDALFKLVDSPLSTKGTEAGIARQQSAEAISVGKHQRFEADVTVALQNNYRDYKRAIATTDSPRVSEQQFSQEIGRAMHLGDDLTQTDLPESAWPQAQKAMQRIRQKQQELEKELIELEMLPKNVSPVNAKSYMFTRWNPERIMGNEELWNQKLDDYFRVEFDKIRKELIEENSDEARNLLETKYRDDDAIRRDFVDEMTTSITRKIRGLDNRLQMLDYIDKDAGPLRKRGFTIPIDREMTEFMDTDVVDTMSKMSRLAYGRIGLKRTFGDDDLEDVIDKVSQDYEVLRTQAKDQKARNKLAKEQARVEQTIEQLWELNLGTFKTSSLNPDGFLRRASNFARNYNFLRFMGGRVLSSLPDAAMPIFVHGLSNVYGDSLKPLVKALKDPKLRQALRETKEEVGDFAIAMEHVLNARNQELYNLSDPYVRGSGIERLTESATAAMSKYSGANWWDNTMKTFAHIAGHQRLMRVSRMKKFADKDLQFFAKFGLDADDLREVGRLSRKHGSDTEGIQMSGMDRWENQGLRDKVETALWSINRSTILTKGFADAPIFTNTEAGKLITQFMSHVFASNHRILAVAAQNPRNAGMMFGLASMASLGMMVEVLKAYEVGREPSTDPVDLIVAGVDRSGIASVPMYVRGLGQKFGVDPLSFMGATAPSRYAQFGLESQLLGPTVSTLQDVRDFSMAASDIVSGEELSASKVKNLTTNLLPFATLPGVKSALAEAKRTIDEEFK